MPALPLPLLLRPAADRHIAQSAATRQLAVLREAKAAFWSEYGAQKGESSFLLGIRSLSMYIDAILWFVPGGAA